MLHHADSSRKLLVLRRTLTVAAVGLGAMLLLRQDVVGLGLSARSGDRMAAELLLAAERADTCSARNAVGVGLKGEYFAKAYFSGPATLVRVDDVVDLDPSIEWPTGTAMRPGSIRWSGWIKPPLSGKYRFHAGAPNMQVLVGRNIVAGEGASPDGSVDLAAGRFYPIEVAVSRLIESDIRIKLEWTAPHGARYVIQRALLHLPTERVAAPRD